MKIYFLLLCNPLLFGTLAEAGTIIDKTVAVVNDEVILASDLTKFQVRLKTKSFQELFGGMDSEALKDPSAVLELLIEEKIINQQVKKLELRVSEQEVDGQIRSIALRNGISQSQLIERLQQLGTTLADYREGIQRQLERRNLVEREIRPLMDVSEEQVRRYHARNAKKEDREVQYNIAHILISEKPGGISNQERANRVWDEVSKVPGRFDDYIKEYSDDTSTPNGVLGYYSVSSLAKEFRTVVPQTELGQITRPIKTPAGFHILKVLDIRAGEFSSLSKERKELIKQEMISQEIERRMAAWLDKKKTETFIKRTGKTGG